MAASAEEISATGGGVRDRATKASEETAAVNSEVSCLVAITSSLNESKKQLDGLRKMMAEMAKSIQLINTIVNQTKRLSLNATIEAARAGDHDKGTAVVAQEVRSLSQSAGSEL